MSDDPVTSSIHDLSALNTMRLPCVAQRYIELQSDAQISQFFSTLNEDVLILGGGSNVILPAHLGMPVLKLDYDFIRVVAQSETDVTIQSGASVQWDALVAWSVEQGLHGLENLSLIPGTVGAAPVQNIGAYGVELKDTLISVRAFDIAQNQFVDLSRDACQFAYRDSLFKHESRRYAILDVTLRLSKQAEFHLEYGELQALQNSPDLTLQRVRDTVIAVRSAKLPDPANIPNTGSFFKNPIVPPEKYQDLLACNPTLVAFVQKDGRYKLAAGWLIDQLGFKGHEQGRAKVHEKQALVLTNAGGACQEDILALAGLIQHRVHEAFGVTLEIEPVVL